MFVLLITLVVLYTIIIFTVSRIRKKACEFKETSTSTRKTHSHIQRVLAIQASVPIIICLPISLVILQAFFEFESLILSDLTITFGIWYTSIKVFMIIMVVPHYRRVFFSPLTRLFSGNQIGNVTAQN
jgi:hypothetical protein